MKAPITIEIILHYYCSMSEDFRDSPAFRSHSKYLVENNILIETTNGGVKFEINREAADVYIEALLAIPFPEKKYMIPTQIDFATKKLNEGIMRHYDNLLRNPENHGKL